MTYSSIQKIAHYQIDGEKSLIDYLNYDGRSYWWAIDFGIDSQLTRNNQCRSRLRRLVARIYHIVNSSIPINDIMQFCFAHLFSLMYVKKTEIHNSTSLTIVLRQILNRDWKVKIDSDNNQYMQNIYHHSVMENLGSSIRIISPYTNLFDVNVFMTLHKFKKILSFEGDNIETVLYYKYWCPVVWKYAHRAHLQFKKVWKLLKTKRDLFNLISETYGIPYAVAYELFHIYIIYDIPKQVKYMKLTESLVRREHVKLLYMTDEYCDGRTFVSVGKKLGIPTIAVQHGVMFNHSGYLSHSEGDVSRMNDTSIPLPDTTCVWGEGEQDLLYNEGHYPKGSVIVTGNPRYDYLSHAHELYSREDVCKRYGINPNQKIILWTTQCHGNLMEENNQYYKEVFGTIKSLENTVLIVKQHPNEGNEYTKLIQQYINEYHMGTRVILPDKTTDTTELVYVSDVLINKHSTTGQEAVAFHKPMIILDFTDKPDYSEYVKEGVADAAFEDGRLKLTLVSILEHGFHKEENQDIFIRKHMYKLDGCAAKRVADVILSQIQKSEMAK